MRCFEEGVLESVRDANIGSIFGIGFAPYGRVVRSSTSASTVSQRFVERAKVLAKRYSERFSPPQLLLDKAAKGRVVPLIVLLHGDKKPPFAGRLLPTAACCPVFPATGRK